MDDQNWTVNFKRKDGNTCRVKFDFVVEWDACDRDAESSALERVGDILRAAIAKSDERQAFLVKFRAAAREYERANG